MNRLIATVAVENTFFSAGDDYDYYVPQALNTRITCGTRVTVPFGRSNIKRHGIVVKLFYAVNSQLKEICSVMSAFSASMISTRLITFPSLSVPMGS